MACCTGSLRKPDGLTPVSLHHGAQPLLPAQCLLTPAGMGGGLYRSPLLPVLGRSPLEVFRETHHS